MIPFCNKTGEKQIDIFFNVFIFLEYSQSLMITSNKPVRFEEHE